MKHHDKPSRRRRLDRGRITSCLVTCALATCLAGGVACNDAEADTTRTTSSKKKRKRKRSKSEDSSKTTASASATAATSAKPKSPGIESFGGPDWQAVYVGDPLVSLPDAHGGGQGSGGGDFTRVTGAPHGHEGWKYGHRTGGGIHWSPSKKIAIVENYNIKADPTRRTVGMWIKNALVRDVKHTEGPLVRAVGPHRVLALTGAGTCKMKSGADADFYWRDLYSRGDFAHSLSIVVVGKDAPDAEKKAALSTLRTVRLTDKAKPHYKLAEKP